MMWLLPAALFVALLSGPPFMSAAAPQHPATRPRVNANAVVLKDFAKRVDDFVAQHRKLDATLPKLSKRTDPKEMDAHERALAALLASARKNAKPGDLLTPAMQRLVRSMLRPIFAGKAGQQIRGEIMDKEYKGNVKLVVNGRYPDEVPVSTVPPQVLEGLPKLPEELEYRFIQNSLILFDSPAHIIVDFMNRSFT